MSHDHIKLHAVMPNGYAQFRVIASDRPVAIYSGWNEGVTVEAHKEALITFSDGEMRVGHSDKPAEIRRAGKFTVIQGGAE